MPVASMAGNDRNEPPPATALSTPARKAATTSQIQRQSMAAEAMSRGIDLILRDRGRGKASREGISSRLSKALNGGIGKGQIPDPDAGACRIVELFGIHRAEGIRGILRPNL